VVAPLYETTIPAKRGDLCEQIVACKSELRVLRNSRFSSNLASVLPRTTMLHESRNMAITDNMLVREGLQELRRRLPPGWSTSKQARSSSPVDTTIKITAPDRRSGSLVLKARALHFRRYPAHGGAAPAG
jgi:hypothetical protein